MPLRQRCLAAEKFVQGTAARDRRRAIELVATFEGWRSRLGRVLYLSENAAAGSLAETAPILA